MDLNFIKGVFRRLLELLWQIATTSRHVKRFRVAPRPCPSPSAHFGRSPPRRASEVIER